MLPRILQSTVEPVYECVLYSDMLIRTLDNKDTRIIHTLNYGPKWCFISDLENQYTLNIRPLMIGPYWYP